MRSFIGKDGKTFTGLIVKAKSLPGEPTELQANPLLHGDNSESEGSDADKSDEDEVGIDTSTGLPCTTNLYLGWRCSYRAKEPENPNRETMFKRLTRKAAKFPMFNDQAQKAQRHLPEPTADRRALAWQTKHDASEALNAYRRKFRTVPVPALKKLAASIPDHHVPCQKPGSSTDA